MDSASALRVEKTTLKPVIKKTYVLDTNVLLHDPMAITAFKQHRVVIPMTVLEELDHIKDTSRTAMIKASAARRASLSR